jgi:hypothetical protein
LLRSLVSLALLSCAFDLGFVPYFSLQEYSVSALLDIMGSHGNLTIRFRTYLDCKQAAYLFRSGIVYVRARGHLALSC